MREDVSPGFSFATHSRRIALEMAIFITSNNEDSEMALPYRERTSILNVITSVFDEFSKCNFCSPPVSGEKSNVSGRTIISEVAILLVCWEVTDLSSRNS